MLPILAAFSSAYIAALALNELRKNSESRHRSFFIQVLVASIIGFVLNMVIYSRTE